jgi:hypothetical protein
MPIVVKFKVSGMPAAKYDEVHSRLDAAGHGAPPGRLYHVSYGSHDNLQVVDVWDSPQSFEAFGRHLVPILQDMGIQAEPEIHDTHRII